MKLDVHKIRSMLAEKGWSQSALAERAGMTRQQISELLIRGTCTRRSLVRIGSALGCAGPELVDGSPEIVVTSDGATITARMYKGPIVLKSAEAKCSPKDVFDFETGAALAVGRLLGREVTKAEAPVATAKPFSLTYLSSGRFGYTNRGKWFVVVEGRLVYVTGGEGWDDIADLNADGSFRSGHRIEFVVDAYSLSIAKYRASKGNYVWQRNK